ncbi:MAG TPA: MFS transporter [Trebonia sp.]|nr:MFS transporter [Trebonia sp.]
MPRPARPPVLLSYAAFVLIGVTAGTGGVLLVAQMSGYGVDRATIGVMFFTNSIGFVLAGLSNGALIRRLGFRAALGVGSGGFVLVGLYLATRPPFVAFLLVQVVLGYATGVLESVLNAYIASLPEARGLLNRLHAFFGVGALIGPVLASWMLGLAPWPAVWLVLAVACAPLMAGFLMTYPGRPPAEAPGQLPETPAELLEATAELLEPPAPRSGGLLGAALRERGVVLGAVLLAVYVGLEIGVGNWGFSYLVQDRGLASLPAGYAVSGYWLGLTVGRFLISPIAARIGTSTARMIYGCMIGVIVAATLAWLAPGEAPAIAALALLGFFLGPIFPTTMAIVPRLTDEDLAPTAIGIMNAGGIAGGSALPWLAGVITQGAGMWTLLPFTVTLGVLELAAWRPIARRIQIPQTR